MAQPQPQHPDAHLPPETARYSVSICWSGYQEADPPVEVEAPVNCRVAVFKEKVAERMSEPDYDECYPDQLTISVNQRQLGEEDIVPEGATIEVHHSEDDYQSKFEDFVGLVSSPEEQEYHRQLVCLFARLPHQRTGTMDRSTMMERFVHFLKESHLDSGQLWGGSCSKHAWYEYFLGMIQEQNATKESVLEELED